MNRLALLRVGDVTEGLIQPLLASLNLETGLECFLVDDTVDPDLTFEPRRRQHNCRMLLPMIETIASRYESKALAVADVDLFSPIFKFVLGEAQLGGKAGIFSLYRLRPTFYGLQDDAEILQTRAEREAIHETGHMYGLHHCHDPSCVMRFSATAEEVDIKSASFCPECRRAFRVSTEASQTARS